MKIPCRTNREQSAFTLLELLISMGVISVLVAMLIPAVQNVRESARRTTCLNNLRAIGIAALNYEGTFKQLPPGTLGFPSEIRLPDDVNTDQYIDPTLNHEYYWKNAQHSSALSLLLSFLELSTSADSLPREHFAVNQLANWSGDTNGAANIFGQTIEIFSCATDPKTDAQYIAVTTQPAGIYELGTLVQDYFLVFQFDNSDLPISMAVTNYAGCSGAHSGKLYYPEPGLDRYVGAMACRKPIRVASITDGTSQTILFGETIGQIVDGIKKIGMSWVYGGLARGRGGVPWNLVSDDNEYFLGDHQNATVVGFGSWHPTVVNYVRADGSCDSVSRGIDLATWYAMCGREDGNSLVELP